MNCKHAGAVSFEVSDELACHICPSCHSSSWTEAGTRIPLTEALAKLREACQRPAVPVSVPETPAPPVKLEMAIGVAPDQLLTSAQVARVFGVTQRSVDNWANGGRLRALRTAGGQLRFQGADVLELLEGQSA
jgi:excisionase family DNA binding protein